MHTTPYRPGIDGLRLAEEGFRDWLRLLNYSRGTREVLPGHIREFFRFLEKQGKSSLTQLRATDGTAFIRELMGRTGPRTEKPYSPAHINKYIQALRLLDRYLGLSTRAAPGFTLQRLKGQGRLPLWLTREQVARMYEATTDDVLGIRDRAMLAVYYGCGLRLGEGAALRLPDIIAGRRLLYVRKAKGYKQRYVPLADGSYRHLLDYIDTGRPDLLQAPTEWLFIGGGSGKPLCTQSLYLRVKRLATAAGLKIPIGVHTLRHSIATHLLQSGMELGRISEFLGHSSLDSTQIYTHLVNQ
jgi:integrase/recombinase XerD